ncbi:MAG: lactoylglutathione lyase [Pseudomonadota bacterium]
MPMHGEQHPGVKPAPAQTQGFRLNHTMLRVKDPERALAFYSQVFGMQVMRRLDFEEMQFSLYFLANLEDGDSVPEDTQARTAWTFSQKGLLELTHNWGTENQQDFAYHDGNAEPQGFGHICFSVPDLAAAQTWFDEHDVTFVKRADQGKMKDVVFVKDPDGYWIEVIQADLMAGKGE